MIFLEVIFDIENKKKELSIIEKDLSTDEIWNEPERLTQLQKKKALLLDILLPFDSSLEKLNYLEELLSISDEDDIELLTDLKKEAKVLNKRLDSLELSLLLSGETDKNNAIVTIHPGAGGVESQDWAQMLMRMYLKWAENKGFVSEIVDIQPGEEAGIKDVTITISGNYAFGYLKAEAGVHRLVRISPFDANKRRHTSFAAVLVLPEIEDDVKVDIRDDDLKIDTFRASGAGGQHVNKVSSAIRITHIPTGIVVTCQSERSQLRNKMTAMKVLKSKLYTLQMREKEKKIESLVGDKKDISWGNQIRSYVLHPYRLVKDHRTGLEVGDVDSVLNGEIDIFIFAYLKLRH
ncbi:MAG: peptide chain release factor 2 [Thermodesulfovibrionales bacterium]|nr:peptide chain release factor 2 [Thermodesulfovibrionales bacterium]